MLETLTKDYTNFKKTTIIQINNDIDILNKKCSTLDSKVNEVSSEAKEEMSVQMIDVKSKPESMEEGVNRQRKETREQIDY